ncbi:hypothetical protein [Streptomyces sp. NPDC001089]
MRDAGTGGGGVVAEEPGGASDTESAGGADHEGHVRRRRPGPAVVAVGLAFLAVVAGGVFWLFHDEWSHPFGDARACAGSDAALTGRIAPGGVPLPEDATDIHYLTRHGLAEVSFRSGRVPDYLHRVGLVPEGEPLMDEDYGGAYGWADDGHDMPDGLCGPALKGPVWSYRGRGGGPGVGVLVERAPGGTTLRTPARVIASYDIG